MQKTVKKMSLSTKKQNYRFNSKTQFSQTLAIFFSKGYVIFSNFNLILTRLLMTIFIEGSSSDYNVAPNSSGEYSH